MARGQPVLTLEIAPRLQVHTENKGFINGPRVTLGSIVWCAKCGRVHVLYQPNTAHLISSMEACSARPTMTQPNEPGATEEIVLPENLLPLGSVLGQGVTPLDVCMVLAKVFKVQYTEVALLRLEEGLLRFMFPEHLRTTGAIPLSSKSVAAHTALSKKAEIFNNFAKVKHASIFETIKPN